MLTVDFARMGLRPGDRVLDMGCGAGRHTYEAVRRGARVVALDVMGTDVEQVAALLAAMADGGEGAARHAHAVVGDGARLPFPDHSFDRVVAAEVLEHVVDDEQVMADVARVLRPGGVLAASVPRWFPEQLNWALSREYHQVEGGHVRIYRRSGLGRLIGRAGLETVGAHHAHALHTPWWWLRCAVGVTREDQPLVRAYHRVLVWDITHPRSPLRLLERVLDPVLGKSLVVYARKPC